MAFIRGTNVILFVYDGGQWKPVICARNCSLTTNAETIETSITGSGVWRTFEYTGLTWSANLDGAIFLDGVNELTASDLRAFQFGRQKILIRYQRTDEAGNVYVDEGNAIITSISDSGEYTNINTYTVDLIGTGPLNIVFTPTPINPTAKVKRLEYNGVSGETFFSNSALIGKDIMEVVVDGIGRSEILTFGTPTGQQCKYTSGTGRIDFPMGLETGTEVYVLYQDI